MPATRGFLRLLSGLFFLSLLLVAPAARLLVTDRGCNVKWPKAGGFMEDKMRRPTSVGAVP